MQEALSIDEVSTTKSKKLKYICKPIVISAAEQALVGRSVSPSTFRHLKKGGHLKESGTKRRDWYPNEQSIVFYRYQKVVSFFGKKPGLRLPGMSRRDVHPGFGTIRKLVEFCGYLGFDANGALVSIDQRKPSQEGFYKEARGWFRRRRGATPSADYN